MRLCEWFKRSVFILNSIPVLTDANLKSQSNTVFSSNYKPYGPNYGLSETLAIFNLEYAHKSYDSATGF